jgi:hypothetical protein
MEQLTREGIFEMAAKMLRQDFEELRTVPHAALRGGEAEDLVRRFLQDHIPRRFSVGTGFILDLKDNVSRQTDVIVYDALNCPIYRASETAAIFPANNVAGVVEVKSKLDSDTLKDAFDKIESVKSLAKVKPPNVDAPIMTQTHGSVFAFESALSLGSVADRYRDWMNKRGLGHHTDVVCVLDKGIVSTAASVPGFPGWGVIFLEGFGGGRGEGVHIGLGIQHLGAAALDAYFRLLLVHLTLFRGIVDHPGFNWSGHLPKGMMEIRYLTSITNEKDPEKREKKLKEYADQVREEFSKAPVPTDWPKK